MNLETPLAKVPGVGNRIATTLKRLELYTVKDLLHHYPFRYSDFSHNVSVANAPIGEMVTIQGEIWSIKNSYTRFRKVMTKAIFNDGTGSVELVWLHQPWLKNTLQTGTKIQISGKIEKKGNKLVMLFPEWEKIQGVTISSKKSLHTGRLVPIYSETNGINSKWLRNKIAQIFPLVKNQLEDPLPKELRQGMLDYVQALYQIHFPENLQLLEQARERLAFQELFEIQLATQKIRMLWQTQHPAHEMQITEKVKQTFIYSLPFKLTNAQQRVLEEIWTDLTKNRPMNRLLQGEVGSGKTVVAAGAIYAVAQNNFNSLLMAPTEILAWQHYQTLKKILEPLGVSIGIYTGSKKQVIQKLEGGLFADLPTVIVGTHALLSEKLVKEKIGLVVVDEQQRFGVAQRGLLRSQSANNGYLPHFLTMTATPIPRTVALTVYGDLDLSIIDELPQGRQPIKTYVVPSKKRVDAYKFIAKKVAEGDQVYIITPLIEESETLQTVKAAKKEFAYLSEKIFPQFKLGLLHGRLKTKEKEEVLQKFKEGEIQILVSTSVVEVGVDVPNATIMVIEGAERFGLAQLHQLRGRVGRGSKESYCLLFAGIEEIGAIRRLKNLEKINDGLKLAEIDLKIRGAGELFGYRQSGRFELKIANLNDLKLIERTKQAAMILLSQDPTLDKHPHLKAKLQHLEAIMPD